MVPVEIGEPIGNITDGGVGIPIFVLKSIIGSDSEADMVDPIEQGVDEILAKEGCICPVILHQVKPCFRAILIVAMVADKKRVARLIGSDPLVDPAHLIAAQPGGIPVGLTGSAQGSDALQDQPVEVVGCRGATRDVCPADPASQPTIGNDQFGGAIQIGVGRCDIRFQRSEPAGDIGDGCIGITILIEKLTVGIDFKSEVVDPIQHRIDKIEPAKFLVGPIILYVVKACGDTILIIPMQDLKGAPPGSITA